MYTFTPVMRQYGDSLEGDHAERKERLEKAAQKPPPGQKSRDAARKASQRGEVHSAQTS